MNFDYCVPKDLKLMSCEHWKRKLISLIPMQFYHKFWKIQKKFGNPLALRAFRRIVRKTIPAFPRIAVFLFQVFPRSNALPIS
jgi:hypothetical protein